MAFRLPKSPLKLLNVTQLSVIIVSDTHLFNQCSIKIDVSQNVFTYFQYIVRLVLCSY